jgi:UDP-N-acetylglucosamine--N-acetylmuramyl-(pentapeptide) pyrophosphoryl-undecaprenol N-acetylglucosamine transferase
VRVLIAGGGTGGHLFPGVALAEAFRAKDSAKAILFVGTDNPLETSTLAKKGFAHVSIAAEGLRGRGLWRQVRSLAKIPKGFLQSVKIIRRFDPDIVIGVGGYVSGPVALAARLMGKKLVIHEQNFTPGSTNRLLARFAHCTFISFPDDLAQFKRSKAVVTGNPVRRELFTAEAYEKSPARFAVLVVGGSQGAHAINRAVVDALDNLKDPRVMNFIHQTGPKDAAWVARAYETRGIEARVEPFFEDMACAYRSADLVICRAGATTVAELTALGKPAIFIPFPFAVNNHQELNARYVADSGGGELILEKDLGGPVLARRIDYFASHGEALQRMSARASALGRPDAADLIVDECRRLVGGGGH